MQADATFLAHVPPFAGLPEGRLAALRPLLGLRSLKKGEVLFLQGDAAQAVFIVASGWVKLFRETLDGQEHVVHLCREHDVFGEGALFNDGTYAFSAEATEDATLLTLSLAALRQLIAQDSDFSLRMMARFSERLHRLELKAEHSTAMRAPQRIGCFLLSLCAPAQQENGTASFTLPMEKGLIAAHLAMKPETFSRALKELETWGVAVDGREVIIRNIRVLQQQACISCSDTEQCRNSGDC